MVLSIFQARPHLIPFQVPHILYKLKIVVNENSTNFFVFRFAIIIAVILLISALSLRLSPKNGQSQR